MSSGQLPKPDPDELIRVRAVDFARLLDLALDLAGDPFCNLADTDREFLDLAEGYLAKHAPVTARSHSERRRVVDAWGQTL